MAEPTHADVGRPVTWTRQLPGGRTITYHGTLHSLPTSDARIQRKAVVLVDPAVHGTRWAELHPSELTVLPAPTETAPRTTKVTS